MSAHEFDLADPRLDAKAVKNLLVAVERDFASKTTHANTLLAQAEKLGLANGCDIVDVLRAAKPMAEKRAAEAQKVRADELIAERARKTKRETGKIHAYAAAQQAKEPDLDDLDAHLDAEPEVGPVPQWFDDGAPPNEQPAAPPKPIGYSFAQACNAPLSSPYIVKGIIAPGSVSVFFGDSGALKSFVATDLAGHVAASQDWHGKRVNGGGVLVVLGEGQGGYAKRLRAWAQAKAIAPESVKLYVYPRPVDLNASPVGLAVAIAEAEAALGCKVILDVVDTYSTNLGDGEEDSNSDAARVLGNSRMAAGPDRATAFIHHVGHSDGNRERGAYQLRANADFRFQIKRDGNTITMTNVKAKDSREIEPMQFAFRSVDLGNDADGDPITSLVIDAASGIPARAAAARKPVTGHAKTALQAFDELAFEGKTTIARAQSTVPDGCPYLDMDSWRERFMHKLGTSSMDNEKDRDRNRRAWADARAKLRDAAWIFTDGPIAWRAARETA